MHVYLRTYTTKASGMDGCEGQDKDLIELVYNNLHSGTELPYSLKISRVKIFVEFVDFGVPTKILALKNLSYSIIQCNTSAIHEKFIHKIAKIAIPRKF